MPTFLSHVNAELVSLPRSATSQRWLFLSSSFVGWRVLYCELLNGPFREDFAQSSPSTADGSTEGADSPALIGRQ